MGIHVNNFALTATDDWVACTFKGKLASFWTISDLGEAKFCVGIAIKHDLANRHIFLYQTALIDKVLAQFNMTNANPVSTPMESDLTLSCHPTAPLTHEEELELQDILYCQLVRLLMYIAVGTHPDIALAIQKLSQFLSCYTLSHWAATK